MDPKTPISCKVNWIVIESSYFFKKSDFITFTMLRMVLRTFSRNYYRPQRSWGKVMFSHMSVILFTGGEVVSQHALQVLSKHALQQVSGEGGGIPACLAGFQAHTQGGS